MTATCFFAQSVFTDIILQPCEVSRPEKRRKPRLRTVERLSKAKSDIPSFIVQQPNLSCQLVHNGCLETLSVTPLTAPAPPRTFRSFYNAWQSGVDVLCYDQQLVLIVNTAYVKNKQKIHPVCSCHYVCNVGLPRWLSGKESTCNAGDADLIPGSGRSPGGGNGNPLQYSCLGNPKDRVWRATVHGVTNSRTQLSTHVHACRSCQPRTTSS